MMAKSQVEIPQDRLDLYEALIASHAEIDRKGVSMPYTSANGHMFTHLAKDGTMGLRLPGEEREAFLKKYDTTLFVQHGAVMKEYVTVTDQLLEQTEVLQPYLQISFDYVRSLKPKPTRKKKKP